MHDSIRDSFNADAFVKGLNQPIFLLVMSKIIGQTGSLQEEKNFEITPAWIMLCHILFVLEGLGKYILRHQNNSFPKARNKYFVKGRNFFQKGLLIGIFCF